MSKARGISNLVDTDGDVVSGALDNVPPSNDASALTTGTLPVDRVPYIGRRNIIINGAMDFDQRYSGTAHTIPAYTNTYVLDRWFGKAQPTASKFSVQQVAASGDALASGFEKCSEISSLTTHTQTSGDIYSYMHAIEGLNSKHLQWGTGNAKTVTMSFWVKSSKTGTHGGSFLDASNAYTYPFSYSVSSANTWEQKTVTLTGPTSGTFNKTNAIGLQISFGLSVGSSFSGTAGSWSGTANIFGSTGAVNVLDSSSNTWSITGVQLEVGSVVTPFEHRSFGEELALCQRYFCKIKHDGSYRNNICLVCNHNDITHYGVYHFPVTMRSAPTGTVLTGTYRAYPGGASTNFSESAVSMNIFSPESVRVGLASSGGAVGDAHWLECYLSGSGLLFDAEL